MAIATPGWTSPANFTLPANASPYWLHVAYQTGGTATIAYLEVVSQSPLQTVLHVGVIPPGGSYQEQMRIPSTSASYPVDISLAQAPDGAAVVEWAALQGSNPTTSPYTYTASYRPAGSASWGAPVTVATDSTRTAGISEYLSTAVSANGTAAAGVDHVDPTIPSPYGYRIDVAINSGGSWGASAQISPPADSSEQLALGFDATGDLTAAFRLRMGNGRYTLAVKRRPATTGIWGSLEDVTGSDITSDVEVPQLAVAPDGSAVLAFQYVHYAAPYTVDVNAVTRSGQNGAWSSPVNVGAGGASSAPMAAGISPNDTAYILYRFQGTSSGLDCNGVVRASVGGAFTSPHCVSPLAFENSSAGGVTFLGNDAYFAWSGQPNGSGGYVAEGSRWTTSAAQPDSFTDLESPTNSITFNGLVGDEDGGAAAFWLTSSGSVRVSAFDTGGPNLMSANVPSSATAGSTVTMSASFADLWSGVAGALSWSFGDGASGSGAQVSHTYAAGGTYTITVTALDGLGNSTSATFPVTVAPATPSPVPAATLTHIGQSAPRWREHALSHKRRGKAKALPVGTTFRFTLNTSATVTLKFRRRLAGRRVGGRCVAPTRRNRHRRACTRQLAAGSLTVAGRGGANRIPFAGRLANHRLLPAGSYTVVFTAAGGAGPTAQLSFTIATG